MLSKKLIILLLSMISWGLLLNAQEVQVLKKSNQRPVGDVNIVNLDQEESTFTNDQGKASLEAFSRGDTLTFKHSSYFPVKIAFSELANQDFKVMLSERLMNLEEVVISGSRWEQRRANIPNKIRPITEEEVAFDNPQTSADLLDASNEVFVQKSQLGGGSPMIRGFATKSVLLTVDGVRMNNAIFRGGNLQNVINIDPHAIERSEVIFGPGSVIYGSDALGGVMAFHTKEPELAKTNDVRVNGSLMTRFATANNENTGHAEINIGTEKWGFFTSATYSDFEDLKMGTQGHSSFKRDSFVRRIKGEDVTLENEDPNVQKPSGFSEYFLMQKVRFKSNDHWDFKYGFHYSRTSEIPRYDRLIQRKPRLSGPFKNATWYYGPQIWMMNNLKVKHSRETALYDEAKLTLAQQFYKESRHDRGYREVSLRHRQEQVDIYTSNLDLRKTFSENTRLFYGLQGVYNYVHSDARLENVENGATKPTATRYPDGSDYQTYAAYGRLVHDFNKQWTINVGARYTRVALNADLTENLEYYDFDFRKINLNTGALNGNVGLVYKPDDSWRFKLNASSGFRAPNIDDVGKVFDSEPGSVVVPNDNLSPEYTYNGDLGIVKHFRDKARIAVNGFYTLVTDAMVRRPTGGDSIIYDGVKSQPISIQNAAGSDIYGGSISFRAAITPSLKIKAKYTQIEGETDNGEPIRHVAPPFGAGHLIYEKSGLKLDCFAKFNRKLPNSQLSPSEQDKLHMYALTKDKEPYSPGWYTLNFRAGYEFNESLSLNVGVENILDKRYRPYSSGIVAPGRNIYLTLRGHF